MNPTKVDRDVLLQWFSTLDMNTLHMNTLRKAWRHVMSQQATPGKASSNIAWQERLIRLQRRQNVEKATLMFLDRWKSPTTEQWYEHARKLRLAGFYSPTTSMGDIVQRLKAFQKRISPD